MSNFLPSPIVKPSMKKRGDVIRHRVVHAGDVKIECAYVWQNSAKVMAIGIQTSERCVVEGTGGGTNTSPSMCLSLTGDGDNMTEVSFPDYNAPPENAREFIRGMNRPNFKQIP